MVVLLVGSIARAQDVRYNFDPGTDFTKYKTYAWVDVQGGDKADELTDKQIRNAINSEIVAKGLTMVEGANADLSIAYHLAISQEKEIRLTGTGYGRPVGWGGMGTVYGDSVTIPIGAITLDMYDTGRKELVWRGVATKQIDVKASPEKRDKNLRKGAQKLLKNYPPKKKS
jgi:hypothetical protein